MRRTVPWRSSLAMPTACLLLVAAARADPPEDEAHRIDRLRTQELNQAALKQALLAAPARVLPPPRTPPSTSPPVATPEDGALHTSEERALIAWRARVAACRAGDWKFCDHH